MSGLMKQLYKGDLYPGEEIGTCIIPEEHKRNSAIEEEKTYFKSSLSQEDKKRYENFENLLRDSENDYAFRHFTYGFRLGVRLMIETLADDN